jgi:starch-binding outer membrane protein, SusD/RagB family
VILQERRKELPFTADVRWEDLRRLNKDPNFQKTIVRVLNGTTYTLPPNDPKYVLPIPENEVQLSGLQQNPE